MGKREEHMKRKIEIHRQQMLKTLRLNNYYKVLSLITLIGMVVLIYYQYPNYIESTTRINTQDWSKLGKFPINQYPMIK